MKNRKIVQTVRKTEICRAAFVSSPPTLADLIIRSFKGIKGKFLRIRFFKKINFTQHKLDGNVQCIAVTRYSIELP